MGVQTPDTMAYSLSDVQVKPQVVSAPAPGYRTCFQDAGIRGLEGLEFIVDTSGHVERGSVDVLQSADPILDSLAVADARGEVFRAARKGGIPVRVRVQQPFRFGVATTPAATKDSGVFALSCVDQRPEVLKGPAVAYPELEREAGHQGTVWAVFTVDTAGHLVRGSLSIDSSPSRFDDAAREILLSPQSLFAPGRIFGHAVSTRMRMAITFTLCGKTGPTPKSTAPDVLDGITVTACPAR